MSNFATNKLSPARQLTRAEQELVWKKPLSHKVSEEEKRICNEIRRNWNRGEMKIANILLEGDAGSGKTQLAKALSAELGLPYTKITCFADMDKSDIIGAILPVIPEDNRKKLEPAEQAVCSDDAVEYRFYPSEIVRAYQHGYLLEIQEPTVIRDAAVLMALNSALELDGSLNLPTGIMRRHPDFIAVITTNRSYAGTRPLNEALRDRVQHTEKMDLPAKEVMIERAISKTGYTDKRVLGVLAEIIMVLDSTARANAIKGVAGMRSFFYWADAVACGASAKESLYHKVIYKITTDPEEIRLLEDALRSHGLFSDLDEIEVDGKKKESLPNLS
ncbi:AAA family ATPase [Paenibacillus jilunlii]|uniref:AAA domain (Dynein-related subfamily) n=1 Tax=Paenibacillus jilunlii TaxID=682956 RepID=A0A1G9NKK2_9BACL|nr:MoxR family ATPase [Paenibacillus jilunlii]KWX77117.1 ATPase [Paenibacillus jilunlii]SDL86843.1 AAA domain (dynein-related subfamily) [Paenibacillus jilunlii]